jgi:hypothetical protein
MNPFRIESDLQNSGDAEKRLLMLELIDTQSSANCLKPLREVG